MPIQKNYMPREIKVLKISTAAQWRSWLEKNHDLEGMVWLQVSRKASGKAILKYEEAISEALCFGWIDSTKRAHDEFSSLQSFTKRKPKSFWSGINKAKVKQLIKDGRMTEHGLKAIKVAKANGYWTILDDVEKLIIPPDLQQAFDAAPAAETWFLELTKSKKKLALTWLVLAQRAETRQQRIDAIVTSAQKGEMPKQLAG